MRARAGTLTQPKRKHVHGQAAIAHIIATRKKPADQQPTGFRPPPKHADAHEQITHLKRKHGVEGT